MARPFPVSDTHDFGNDPKPGEWHALRGELVALLDHVEEQYSGAAVQQPGYDSLARRMRELRSQVAETPSSNRHQEALRSVKRAVDRFSERDETQPFPANPQDILQSAILEIRSRQRAAAPVAVPASAPPQFDKLLSSVNGLTGRLERLEGELRAQRSDGPDVSVIGEQVAQLTHVVELLAGAVGETGQVKRLEGQIAGLADMISGGKNADIQALGGRLEDLALTIDRLALSQQDEGASRRTQQAQQAELGQGMRAIEDNVRSIYDRIDAIEKNVTLSPDEFNRLTEEMAAFTEEMRSASAQVKPGQLLARVDALNARLADMESKDGLVGDLRADVDALRTAIVDAFEPRFTAIESQLGSINDRLSAPRKADPSIAQIEAQIRHLATRMDETGVQLTSLSKLYAQVEAREPAPDFEALATLVAKRTSDAFARSGDAGGINDATFAELEKRMTRMFATAGNDKPNTDFTEVHDGIRRVDERLDRLEATLGERKTAEQLSAALQLPPVAATVVVPGDSMPKNPGQDAPLRDTVYADPSPVRAALDIKTAPVKAETSVGMTPVTPEMVGGKSAKPAIEKAPAPKASVETEAPGFDPSVATRPPRPESSLDRQARDAFATSAAAPAGAVAVEPVTAGEVSEVASASSRNTFIEAARRAAQRQTPGKAEAQSNSLIGRAMARFQTNSEDAAAKAAEAAPARVEPVAVKPVKAPKAEKLEKPVAVIENEDDDDDRPGFLTRYRQPILLAATLVAVGFLALNLISQRMAPPAADPIAIEETVTPELPAEPVAPPAAATPAPAPTGDISALDAPPSSVRAIPGTGAEAAIDSMATGSIDPAAAMNFTKPAELAAIPSALEFVKSAKQASAAPAETLMPTGPVKVEMAPEAVGPVELRQAASDGDARAQFEIAAIYSEGRAVTQDYAQALIWYERAASQGFAPAQYRLGNLYESGKGVTKDLEQARLWYQRAAEAGNRMSMHNLAALYAGGTLGKQEFASAAEWFEQAAARGMTDSQFNLGMLYARGLGVTQDLDASFKWFSLAAGSGDADAAKARDDVAKSLDAATVTRLTADLAAWKAVPIDLAANFAPIGTWNKNFDAGTAITNKAVVVKVQAALVKLGYDVGTPDGLAGPKTAEAIKSFEKSTGMNEIGAINPRLLAVLGSQPV